MKIEAACFTERGRALGERLAAEGLEFHLTRCGGEGPGVGEWTAQSFPRANALLFIGAAGIAVRAVAPYVTAKTSDPAVLVLDEGGRYVIPILSGHIGGANALASRLAALLGAEAVITTATDINKVFAADTWAAGRGYHIHDPARIKTVSARLLSGERAGLWSSFPVEGALPEGLYPAPSREEAHLTIGVEKAENERALRLIPPVLVLGVGCRRGTEAAAIEELFKTLCDKEDLHPKAFGLVCSIDLKKDEPGLLEFCRGRGLPFQTFSAGELAGVPGDFTPSPFVEATTGVDNVCERSAALGGGMLRVKKTAGGGVTMAVAVRPWTVRFEEEL